jgi:hypothetical protein
MRFKEAAIGRFSGAERGTLSSDRAANTTANDSTQAVCRSPAQWARSQARKMQWAAGTTREPDQRPKAKGGEQFGVGAFGFKTGKGNSDSGPGPGCPGGASSRRGASAAPAPGAYLAGCFVALCGDDPGGGRLLALGAWRLAVRRAVVMPVWIGRAAATTWLSKARAAGGRGAPDQVEALVCFATRSARDPRRGTTTA